MLGLHGTTEYPWVVLVEDDESLQGQLAGALERALPEVEVHRTPDADVALQLVCDSRSRLLITEAESAAVDGLSLAACARQQRPMLPLIFLADMQAGISSSAIAGFARSHFVDKPPHLSQFVGLVAHVLDQSPGFRGELSTTGLMELVQLVVMTTPTGALRVDAPEGVGTVWFEEGAVVHAAFQRERGSRAFQRMLRWRSGRFSVDVGARAPERTINLSTTQFLLESARILDEDSADGIDLSGMTCAADHFENGLQAVRHKRYADALPEWERAAALEPGNRLYQHNLTRLRHLINANEHCMRRLGGGDE
jgi:DNA-binding response OmpR family regulator